MRCCMKLTFFAYGNIKCCICEKISFLQVVKCTKMYLHSTTLQYLHGQYCFQSNLNVQCKNNELSLFSKRMETWVLFHDKIRITNHNMFRYSNDHSRMWSYKRKYATPVGRVLISTNSYVHTYSKANPLNRNITTVYT